MGAKVLPPSLISHRAAAVPKVCASRIRLNPACIARPAAAAKKPKRPGSCRDGEPLAKRSRGVCGEDDPDDEDAAKIEKRPRPSRGEDAPNSPRLGVGALFVIKNQVSASPIQRPEHTAPPQTSVRSMRELLAKARPAAEAIRRRDIERRRAEARRKLEQMVRTVEFNDPFIDPQDVFKRSTEDSV